MICLTKQLVHPLTCQTKWLFHPLTCLTKRLFFQGEENTRRHEEQGEVVMVTEHRELDGGNRRGHIVIRVSQQEGPIVIRVSQQERPIVIRVSTGGACFLPSILALVFTERPYREVPQLPLAQWFTCVPAGLARPQFTCLFHQCSISSWGVMGAGVGLLCACILMSRWVVSADAVWQKDLHRH